MRCYVCEKEVSEREAVAVGDLINRTPELMEATTDHWNLVHCTKEGEDFYFPDSDEYDELRGGTVLCCSDLRIAAESYTERGGQ
jgi:hypothetical protein